MDIKNINVGDFVESKKVHPCGGNSWEVLRVGIDYKLKCTKCERIIMIPIEKFRKMIKNGK